MVGLTVLIESVNSKEEGAMRVTTEQVLDKLKITVIYDNYAAKAGFKTAWGFACVIQGADKTILFDTGSDGAVLMDNMAKAGIDPAVIDTVVLSHQHWDHIGGIYHFLDANADVQICLPQSFSAHFKQDLHRYRVDLIEVDSAVEICPGIYSTGDMAGPIREQALIMRTPRGMIVMTGCAHPGIVNIIQTAKTIVPDTVLLVMGGFHLMNDNAAAIGHVVSQFRALDVRYVAASHCTGDRARRMFAEEYRQQFLSSGAGNVITLEQLP